MEKLDQSVGSTSWWKSLRVYFTHMTQCTNIPDGRPDRQMDGWDAAWWHRPHYV